MSKSAILFFLFCFSNLFAQSNAKITGNVKSENGSSVSGVNITDKNTGKTATTDENGNFSIEANAGTYDVKFEFISFKPIETKQQSIQEDKDFGTVSLIAEAGVPNFCNIPTVYLIIISFKVSFAPGSITLNKTMLKVVEIKIPITAAIK